MGKWVTDEDINRLRDKALATGNRKLVEECNLALSLPAGFDREMWRQHCAAIIATERKP